MRRDLTMKEIHEEHQHEVLTDETAIEIRRQRAKRRLENYLARPGHGTPSQKAKKFLSQQFLRIPFKLLDSPGYLEFMTQKRFRTYMYLQRHIVRACQYRAPVDLYQGFYLLRKELAVSRPLAKIAEDLQISKSTARDHIRDLEQDGLLETRDVDASDSNDGRKHNVYVLGTCHADVEILFVDEVFGKGHEHNRKP
jgi:DNA-binding MarR family transcriptional regulator